MQYPGLSLDPWRWLCHLTCFLRALLCPSCILLALLGCPASLSVLFCLILHKADGFKCEAVKMCWHCQSCILDILPCIGWMNWGLSWSNTTAVQYVLHNGKQSKLSRSNGMYSYRASFCLLKAFSLFSLSPLFSRLFRSGAGFCLIWRLRSLHDARKLSMNNFCKPYPHLRCNLTEPEVSAHGKHKPLVASQGLQAWSLILEGANVLPQSRPVVLAQNFEYLLGGQQELQACLLHAW